MKKWMLIVAFAMGGLVFQACETKNAKDTTQDNDKLSASQVPQVVQSAFAAKYPGATNVSWEMDKENNAETYKAKFELNDRKMDVEFTPDGTLVEEDS